MNTNILDYGAVPNGTGICTTAIQAAINACAETGGGRVVVPAGHYVSGTIWLKSHVELHLEHGAHLIASTERTDYNALDAYEQNYGYAPEQWVGQHFILAVEQKDVAITGTGVIDGSGDAFFEEPRRSGFSYWMHGIAQAKDKEQLRPGQLICFVECTDVAVMDVTIRNTPCWGLFLHGCDVVTVRGIKVFNPNYYANTDGLDIDSCRYVTVSDCIIDTGDDAIAIRCAAYRLKDKERVCEHITITNCCLSSCACALRIGVGRGIIRHVQVSNVTVGEAGALLCLMSGYNGAGAVHLEDIHMQHVTGTNLSHVFDITDGSEAGICHVTCSDIRAEAKYGSNIVATTPGTISDLALRNVDIQIQDWGIPEYSNTTEQVVLRMQGVKEALLERVRITVADGVRSEWKRDIQLMDCADVEIYRCQYNNELEEEMR